VLARQPVLLLRDGQHLVEELELTRFFGHPLS
jgi:hypothetical protein